MWDPGANQPACRPPATGTRHPEHDFASRRSLGTRVASMGPWWGMRELEASLQQFGECLLRAQFVREEAKPYFVRWVRQFLSRPATDEPLADQVRRFCEGLERSGRCEDWQVRQAEQALRIHFVNFLNRAEWHRQPASAVLDDQGRIDPVAARQRLRECVRTRHYSYRTGCSYADWVRRSLGYVAQRQGVAHPRVASESVHDDLTHLAVRQGVSASTQNQAFRAILFLCREVLGVDVEGLSRPESPAHLARAEAVPEPVVGARRRSRTGDPRPALVGRGPAPASRRRGSRPLAAPSRRRAGSSASTAAARPPRSRARPARTPRSRAAGGRARSARGRGDRR